MAIDEAVYREVVTDWYLWLVVARSRDLIYKAIQRA